MSMNSFILLFILVQTVYSLFFVQKLVTTLGKRELGFAFKKIQKMLIEYLEVNTIFMLFLALVDGVHCKKKKLKRFFLSSKFYLPCLLRLSFLWWLFLWETSFLAMSEAEAMDLKANLESKGKAPFQVCTLGQTVTLMKDMVSISKEIKKEHQRVFTPSVIEPSFGIG